MSLDDPRPDERDPDRDDGDREDDTDRAIKLAREHVIEAVKFLAFVMNDMDEFDAAAVDVRVRAATTLLEVAGCI